MAQGPSPERPASPFRLNLEQQRKRAKDLLASLRASDAGALQRLHAQHRRVPAAGPHGAFETLSQAQFVIARELGLPSWPKLKAHVLAMDSAWASLARGAIAPDHGMTTLHIRCGSDIKPTLKAAGFTGDFLEYSDALCQGPVLAGARWLDRRADFLADSYGDWVGRSREQIANDLISAEEKLRTAAARYHRIVLWFEHDSYDQLILARCLAQFAATPAARLELVSIGQYPGAVRFIGLGQMPPEALSLLWKQRKPVTPRQLQAGLAVWASLRADDPRPLATMGRAGMGDFPQLAGAVRRHCQELPWTGDGLSLTERLILQLLAERPRTIGDAYRALMMEREPLPWLADLMFRFIVKNMKAVSQPVLASGFDSKDRDWPKELLTITPAGRAVLAGEIDWLSLRPPARWLGGVCIPEAASCWRWDEPTASVVLRRPAIGQTYDAPKS